MITIIDYGMGNLGSIKNMLKKIGAASVISSETKAIEQAEKLILPGVGAFDNAMKNLSNLGIIEILNMRVVRDKVPILGICLGIQLFTKRSEEGSLPGLGWIDAETIRFKFGPENNKLKIPHMGWNTVPIQKDHSVVKGMQGESRFYFVHSYHVVCEKREDILTTTFYGFDFVSSVQKDNIVGVQFHPEKSHKFGMRLLKNFVEWQPC